MNLYISLHFSDYLYQTEVRPQKLKGLHQARLCISKLHFQSLTTTTQQSQIERDSNPHIDLQELPKPYTYTRQNKT